MGRRKVAGVHEREIALKGSKARREFGGNEMLETTMSSKGPEAGKKLSLLKKKKEGGGVAFRRGDGRGGVTAEDNLPADFQGEGWEADALFREVAN